MVGLKQVVRVQAPARAGSPHVARGAKNGWMVHAQTPAFAGSPHVARGVKNGWVEAVAGALVWTAGHLAVWNVVVEVLVCVGAWWKVWVASWQVEGDTVGGAIAASVWDHARGLVVDSCHQLVHYFATTIATTTILPNYAQ